MRREGIRAAAFIPLVIEGKLTGKFMVYHRVPHVFTEAELDLAMAIARQLAQAIQHEKDEQALRESEARMRATVEQATAGVARSDPNGRILFANQKLCEMLGYTESELIGKTIGDVTHPEDSQKNLSLFKQLIHEGKPFEMQKRYLRKNGSILWGHVSVSPVRDADGRITSAVAVAVDVTARKEAETDLQRANELLEQRVRERTHELHKTNKHLQSEIERRKGLEGEILSVSDREQQRLGQELHDGLCQHLTAVAFMTRSIALRLRDHRVVDAADIEKVAELVNKAAIDTRNLSRALHRVDVDAAGLIVALQDLADREIWRTPCRLEAKPSFRIDDDAAAAHLYRIAREAVINANKHAQAREIVLRLERVRQEMVLRVIDDGIGLPKQVKPQQGLGFHIMNYRAQLIGGRLEIDSPATGGTRVSCYLPLHAAQPNKAPITNQLNAATPRNLAVHVIDDLTLRHLGRRGAANA
jgi:PAS domain S-box-containing protein